jgi:hypothetical protein
MLTQQLTVLTISTDRLMQKYRSLSGPHCPYPNLIDTAIHEFTSAASTPSICKKQHIAGVLNV